MTEEADETHKEGRRFLPNHLVEELGVIFMATGAILVLASLLRPEEVGLPRVFFTGALEMMAAVAPWFLTFVLTLLIVFLFALPLLDRSEERHPMKRKVFVLIVLAIIVAWAAFTVVGL